MGALAHRASVLPRWQRSRPSRSYVVALVPAVLTLFRQGQFDSSIEASASPAGPAADLVTPRRLRCVCRGPGAQEDRGRDGRESGQLPAGSCGRGRAADRRSKRLFPQRAGSGLRKVPPSGPARSSCMSPRLPPPPRMVISTPGGKSISGSVRSSSERTPRTWARPASRHGAAIQGAGGAACRWRIAEPAFQSERHR